MGEGIAIEREEEEEGGGVGVGEFEEESRRVKELMLGSQEVVAVYDTSYLISGVFGEKERSESCSYLVPLSTLKDVTIRRDQAGKL